MSLFPGNAGTSLPTHQAVVIVFGADSGEPVALLDGTSITTLRTAAGSALSAELLAPEGAATLAILGTGVQARAHAEAMVRVRPIRRIRVAGRNWGRGGVAFLGIAIQRSHFRITAWMPVEAMITTSEALTASAVRILGCSVAISIQTSAIACTQTTGLRAVSHGLVTPEWMGWRNRSTGRSVDSADQCRDSEGYGEKQHHPPEKHGHAEEDDRHPGRRHGEGHRIQRRNRETGGEEDDGHPPPAHPGAPAAGPTRP